VSETGNPTPPPDDEAAPADAEAPEETADNPDVDEE
jgi:hypothetical protein